MAPSRVLKFERPDAQSDDSPFVLLEAKSRGSKPLDLKVVATEGEFEYSTTLRHDRVGSLRVENCPASEEEWQSILERLFNHEPQSDIQASASVQRDSSISIIVRKNIQGITQRLGAISIGRDKSGIQIDVLGWCATAVDALTENKATSTASSAKVQELEEELAGLKKQLDELIHTKQEDETTLLMKFRDLLNEKKVKIREQQKVIASLPQASSRPPTASQPAPDAIAPEEPRAKSSRGRGGTTTRGRKAGPSRASKRKITRAAADDGESSDDGFDKMDVDAKIKTEPDDTDAGDINTGNDTDRTASTASEEEGDDDDDDQAASNPPSQSSPQPTPGPTKRTEQPPPRRSLPFTNKPRSSAPPPKQPTNDDETDSDDEL